MTTPQPRRVELTAAKCAEYGLAAYSRDADQQTAGYNPLGATATKGCANCLFYMAQLDDCSVVDNYPAPIVPNGLCTTYWTAIPALNTGMQPLEVTIVGGWPEAPDTGMASLGEKAVAHTEPMNHVHSHHSGGLHAHAHVHTADDGSHEPHPPMPDATTAGKERGSGSATATGDDPGLVDRIIAGIKALFGGALPTLAPETVVAAATPPAGPLRLYKDTAGGMRWVAWVSNNGRDRDNPAQIISDAAHKEFVAYLETSGDYPEAWLWHTKGTRWGVADWADYSDGILTMSGTVDKGQEGVAAAVAAEDVGVSHGFHFLYSDKGREIIGWYRSFEISALPPWAAANEFTGMDVVQKEAAMAFSPAKRLWLTEKLGAAQVADLETKSGDIAAALAAQGIERKDIPQGVLDDAAAAAAAAAAAMPSAKEIGAAAADALLASVAFKSLGDGVTALQAKLDAQAVAIKALEDRTKALEVDDDAKVAAAFTARLNGAGAAGAGFRASQADATKVKEGDALAVAAPNNHDWLTKALAVS